jgi:anti-sigma factor RsiW
MSSPQPPMDERERDDLVAYLDGELQGEEARRVEAKLAHDQKARTEADSLKRTWDLLDYLPKPPEPSPSFTNRTLEKVEPIRATGAQPRVAPDTGPQPVSPPGRWPRRFLLVAGWAAAVVLAIFGGYYAVHLAVRPAVQPTQVAQPAPEKPSERDLVRDLRVIENKRLYDPIEDRDELREIGDTFGDDGLGS